MKSGLCNYCWEKVVPTAEGQCPYCGCRVFVPRRIVMKCGSMHLCKRYECEKISRE